MRVLASFLVLSLLILTVTSAHADPVVPTPTADRTPAPSTEAVDATDSSLRSQRRAPSDSTAAPTEGGAPGPEVMRPLPSEPDLCLRGPCATV